MDRASDNSTTIDVSMHPMTEDDLGEVMHIETRSFPDPWTPLAYAMELRHNHDAHYVVARGEEGKMVGYIGWWNMPFATFITHVAVDSKFRGSGIGRLLVGQAASMAADEGASALRLLVRDSNDGARKFYSRIGFSETGREKDYYSNPTEDGIAMELSLEGFDGALR